MKLSIFSYIVLHGSTHPLFLHTCEFILPTITYLSPYDFHVHTHPLYPRSVELSSKIVSSLSPFFLPSNGYVSHLIVLNHVVNFSVKFNFVLSVIFDASFAIFSTLLSTVWCSPHQYYSYFSQVPHLPCPHIRT